MPCRKSVRLAVSDSDGSSISDSLISWSSRRRRSGSFVRERPAPDAYLIIDEETGMIIRKPSVGRKEEQEQEEKASKERKTKRTGHGRYPSNCSNGNDVDLWLSKTSTPAAVGRHLASLDEEPRRRSRSPAWSDAPNRRWSSMMSVAPRRDGVDPLLVTVSPRRNSRRRSYIYAY